jgi:hypothetical protein
MGMMKRAYAEMMARKRGPSDAELAEMALDFDAMQLLDGDWWQHQDTEMVRRELEEIEAQADIETERLGGVSW